MDRLQGKGVSPGVAIAPARFYTRVKLDAEKRPAEDVDAEVALFESARAQAAFQLGELAAKAGDAIGEQNSLLFEIHKMMLEDLDYRDSVVDIITRERVCAAYAVGQTAKAFAANFSGMDDEYMQARAADVEDVSRRVIALLLGNPAESGTGLEPVILVSDDFSPSETAQFSPAIVKGLVTTCGSPNSHTAIFARTMGIPAVIGVKGTGCIRSGETLVLDGETGLVIAEPEEDVVAEYRKKQAALAADRQSLEQYRGQGTQTKNGQKVMLCANIGGVKDAQYALDNDAEGIGLFRSEFLYLERDDFPGEETQFRAYRDVLEKMGERQVIIRTLDIGADKQAPYFELQPEENPALGMRAIRICLTRPEVFKTQLRALYRASRYGNLGIMLPMIASLDEVRRAKNVIEEVKKELLAEGVAFKEAVPVGIMVETPAAALISDQLAKEVDFFSIGTNDLTQYTLAVDRMNDALDEFCDTHHEAVLRLIEMTADNAHKNGIWVGICGELGADEALLERFLAMGIDELSVTPGKILPLRRKICEKSV